MKGLKLSSAEVTTLSTWLGRQGYSVRTEGEALVLQTRGRP